MTIQRAKSGSFSSVFRLVLSVYLVLTLYGCNWIEMLSLNSAGEAGDSDSFDASISADGRFVAFVSQAANLVADVDDSGAHIYVSDTIDGTLTHVSVDSSGVAENSGSYTPSISGNGRFIAFSSISTNLVDYDTNNKEDVFVHDRDTGITSRVSVDNAGNEGDQSSSTSGSPAVSSDGRFVAFDSSATNLVTGDTNNSSDVFVHDRDTGTTSRVSVDSVGSQRSNDSSYAAISGDGRYIAFNSAGAFVAADTNGAADIYVHDRITGATSRISVDSAGNQANHQSYDAVLSGNGRYVAFRSFASNLVAGDNNDTDDIFLHDRNTGVTSRVSVDSVGNQVSQGSYKPSISGDGRFVTFYSSSNSIVEVDGNYIDVFMHDRISGTTSCLSLDAFGAAADGDSNYGAISADGRYVAFETSATNLVENDSENYAAQVIVRAIPQLTITSIIPDHLPKGVTTPVTITGTSFLAGATPSIAGTQLSHVVIVNENTITMKVTINTDTPVGAQDVMVGLPGTGPGPLTGAVATCINCVTFSPAGPPGC